jgi:hypothetical protein
MNVIFHSETDYLKNVFNALLFTYFPDNLAEIFLWKKVDMETVSMASNIEFNINNREAAKKNFDNYKKIYKEYGDRVYSWKNSFSSYTPRQILNAFGIKEPDKEDTRYCEYPINYDLDKLSKLDKMKIYPKEFPVILVIEHGGPGCLLTSFVYPSDFKKSFPIPDFPWIEENVKDILKSGGQKF